MKTLKNILTGIIIIYAVALVIFTALIFFTGKTLAFVLPLIYIVSVIITAILLKTILRKKDRNKTLPILFASLTMVLWSIIFIWPSLTTNLWSYSLGIFIIFLGQVFILHVGKNKINDLMVLAFCFYTAGVLFFKINAPIAHQICWVLLSLTTITTIIALMKKKAT